MVATVARGAEPRARHGRRVWGRSRSTELVPPAWAGCYSLCFRPSVSCLGEMYAFSGSMEPKKQRVWANALYFPVVQVLRVPLKIQL